jgi:hypothetical protein
MRGEMCDSPLPFEYSTAVTRRSSVPGECSSIRRASRASLMRLRADEEGEVDRGEDHEQRADAQTSAARAVVTITMCGPAGRSSRAATTPRLIATPRSESQKLSPRTCSPQEIL